MLNNENLLNRNYQIGYIYYVFSIFFIYCTIVKMYVTEISDKLYSNYFILFPPNLSISIFMLPLLSIVNVWNFNLFEKS